MPKNTQVQHLCVCRGTGADLNKHAYLNKAKQCINVEKMENEASLVIGHHTSDFAVAILSG